MIDEKRLKEIEARLDSMIVSSLRLVVRELIREIRRLCSEVERLRDAQRRMPRDGRWPTPNPWNRPDKYRWRTDINEKV